jgi:hypothetical protein
LLRGLSIATVVFIFLFGITAGVVYLRTNDSGALNQSVVDATQGASPATAAGAPASSSSADSSSPAALDTQSGPAANDQESSTEGQLNLERLQARRGLVRWCALVMGAGWVTTAGWLFYAFERAKAAVSIQGFQSARPGWLGGFLIFTGLGFVATIVELRTFGLGPLISSQTLITTLLMCFGLGAIGYYTSTALGVPTKMRPSVPLATLFLR